MPRLAEIPDRHCVKCGRPGPWRSEGALQCIRCDEDTKVERRGYHQRYHKARGLAMTRLIQAHNKEYDRLLTEARIEIDAEEKNRAKKTKKRAG